MRKILLLMVFMASIVSYNAMSQCGQVGLIGEMTGWADDVMLTRDMTNPDLFSGMISVDTTMDSDASGFVEMKFRANHDWATNWGSADFPTGTAVQDGANIPVPYGTYAVTFDCSTGNYTFTETCGDIGLIGEMTGWADDIMMTRRPDDPDMFMGMITVDTTMDSDASGFVDMKFRANHDWGTNWGSADFPSGIAVQDGANIPVPYGTYAVSFNCASGEYMFTATCADIGLIGEFNGWAEDFWMTRTMGSPDEWTVILSLNALMDGDGNDTIEMKFRAGSDWGTNWGGAGWPAGTGVQDGPNIKVPLDDEGITTDYYVTFNCASGEYNFTHTSGSIGMLGAFNNWGGDIPMHRDLADPNLWRLTRSWYADSEVKFRENADWTINWGGNSFPSGTGVVGGNNILLTAGTYDVTFNYSTLAYDFTPNAFACGEVGMVGDFNTWGDDGSGTPTDVYLVRDPMYPTQFSLEYNFTSSTQLLFRIDADPTFSDVWGGTFPSGTAVNDPAMVLNVPGGKYMISYNCLSHDFNFERLGNAIIAPKVFAIEVDGNLDEADWNISEGVSRVVFGTTETPDTIHFGITYNDAYLYVGAEVITQGAVDNLNSVVFCVDGNKSGGELDESDIVFGIDGAGNIFVMHGPDGYTPDAVFNPTAGGYTVETGIKWSELGVEAAEGGQAGFDLLVGNDYDNGADPPGGFVMGWNGDLTDTVSTSNYGDLIFGQLSCGCISVYNATIGDVELHNQLAMENPTKYVGTYDFDNAYDVVFRKDGSSTVSWSAGDFPSGIATLGGALIPATAGRYRIAFDCISGEYSFVDAISGDGLAMAQYTATPPTIDGDLSEYNLAYGSELLVAGSGPNNNTVSWGALWDGDNLYFAAHVVDAVVEGTNNPWDNDAIEIYIDGDNSKDGTYKAASFDTQLIMDALNESTLWVKADGVAITDEESVWTLTSDGYSIEIRLAWSNFEFAPGKGRSIGWSVANNDSDVAIGRDYQTTWYGTANNWSDNSVLGDLELAGGPYFVDGLDEHVLYNASVNLYPNPTSGVVHIRTLGDVFNGQATIMVTDITGRVIANQSENLGSSSVQINLEHLTNGVYFVNILAADGKRAVKKLIIQ